jgi:hypothetical protein
MGSDFRFQMTIHDYMWRTATKFVCSSVWLRLVNWRIILPKVELKAVPNNSPCHRVVMVRIGVIEERVFCHNRNHSSGEDGYKMVLTRPLAHGT